MSLILSLTATENSCAVKHMGWRLEGGVRGESLGSGDKSLFSNPTLLASRQLQKSHLITPYLSFFTGKRENCNSHLSGSLSELKAASYNKHLKFCHSRPPSNCQLLLFQFKILHAIFYITSNKSRYLSLILAF